MGWWGDFITIATRGKQMLFNWKKGFFFNKWNKCHTSSNCHFLKKIALLTSFPFWKLLKCLSFLRYFGRHSAFLFLCYLTWLFVKRHFRIFFIKCIHSLEIRFILFTLMQHYYLCSPYKNKDISKRVKLLKVIGLCLSSSSTRYSFFLVSCQCAVIAFTSVCAFAFISRKYSYSFSVMCTIKTGFSRDLTTLIFPEVFSM